MICLLGLPKFLIVGVLFVGTLAVPVNGHGQPVRVVYIGGDTPAAIDLRRERVVDALERLGHRHGRDFAMTSETFAGDASKLQPLAQRIVESNPGLIYAASWDTANEMKKRTSTIPIVFAARTNLESDAFRIVNNLAAPEGNLTGFTRYVNLIPKKLQLLKEAFPSIRRVGFVYGVEVRPERRIEYELACRKLGIELRFRRFEKTDISTLASRLNTSGDDAYLVAFDDLLTYNRPEYIAQLAQVSKPVVHPEEATDKGVLMHYLPVMDGEAKAAEYISKLLRGAKVRDLAVQEPQEFDFSVNVTTLRRNGLTMSRDVLARARKVE